MEWGQGVHPSPLISPPKFSCVRCWRPVAREPFEFFLSPVLTAESQCQAVCLAVLGAQLRGEAICSKCWALTQH